MPKYKIHGSMYEPGIDNGSDANGYIHFWDVVEAETRFEAFELIYETTATVPRLPR
jgi:hypothetical protein